MSGKFIKIEERIQKKIFCEFLLQGKHLPLWHEFIRENADGILKGIDEEIPKGFTEKFLRNCRRNFQKKCEGIPRNIVKLITESINIGFLKAMTRGMPGIIFRK